MRSRNRVGLPAARYLIAACARERQDRGRTIETTFPASVFDFRRDPVDEVQTRVAVIRGFKEFLQSGVFAGAGTYGNETELQ